MKTAQQNPFVSAGLYADRKRESGGLNESSFLRTKYVGYYQRVKLTHIDGNQA